MRNLSQLRKSLSLLAGLLVAGSLAAQTAPAERAHTLVEALRVKVGSPGMAAAVAVDGKVVWAAGFGEADVENHVPAVPESRFRVGSLSKLLTVAAAARLVEEGRLDLDAPVQRYVPAFPDKGQPITGRQLAGHLAGIRHYTLADELLPLKHYPRLADGLAIFEKDPLLHPPGSASVYSSYGYNLFGAVVEGAAGKDFLTTVDELVIRPLGLTGTMADEPSRIIDRRTGHYRRAGEGIENEQAIDSSYKWPAGGYLSTAPDLVRFGSAHLADGYLKPETRTLLFTSQHLADGKETGVGIGWRIGKDAGGQPYYHHGGSIEGGRAFLLLLPGRRVAVALLSNLSRASFGEAEALELAGLFTE